MLTQRGFPSRNARTHIRCEAFFSAVDVEFCRGACCFCLRRLRMGQTVLALCAAVLFPSRCTRGSAEEPPMTDAHNSMLATVNRNFARAAQVLDYPDGRLQ